MQPDRLVVKGNLSASYLMGSSNQPTFGQRVLQARLNLAARRGRPVTQQEVADAMGVTGVSVGRWEGDRKEPDLATISQLAKVLGVDPSWLAFGDTREVANSEVAAPSLSDVPQRDYGDPATWTPAPHPKHGPAKARKGTPIDTRAVSERDAKPTKKRRPA